MPSGDQSMELQQNSARGKREREAKSRHTDASLSPPFFAGGVQMVEEPSQEADGERELLECDGTYEQGELKPKQFPGERPPELSEEEMNEMDEAAEVIEVERLKSLGVLLAGDSADPNLPSCPRGLSRRGDTEMSDGSDKPDWWQESSSPPPRGSWSRPRLLPAVFDRP